MTTTFFQTKQPLVLASGSPRRQDFLTDLGLDFQVDTGQVDEQLQTNETPHDFVSRLAAAKAKAVSHRHQQAWIIGADTVVAIEGAILGKPEDTQQALEMLLNLNGNWHQVWTGFAVYNAAKSILIQRSVCTKVKFWDHPKTVLAAYVATKESLDKAGAYGIQGRGGLLVEKIEGSYSNVVGLPMAELITIMLEQQVISS